MTRQDKDFIIDTIEVLVEWTNYATDYFKEKYNLEKDLKTVDRSISLLNKPADTCSTCKFWVKSQKNTTLMKCDGDNGCELTGPNFYCGNWEKTK